MATLEDQHQAIREWKEFAPEEVPFNIHPERPGLLYWGCNVDGDVFFWLTKGEPDEWSVVVRPHGYPSIIREMSLTTFLVKAILDEDNVREGIWSSPISKHARDFRSLE